MASEKVCKTDRLSVAWEDHKDRLWRALLAWSGDPEVASESVAEAFAQAARRGDAVEYIDRWVWKAAFRIAAGILADRRVVVDASPTVAEPASSDTLPEDVVALVDALEHLRPRDRELVVMAHVGGWSAADLAALTGSTVGAVRVRLHRARRRLRHELEADDG
jgi:RNA polymerase sigma-70 factor (ECF subfamily)